MTPKLKSHILNPLFLADNSSEILNTSNFDFTYEPFSDDKTIRFLGIVDESTLPLKLTKLHYLTNLVDEELGLIDAIVTLAQEKTLNELKEVKMRELDYYLRLDTSEPSFKYYHDTHYKLIESLERIARYIEDKKQMKPWHKVDRDGPYETLPDFEKLDLVDEILARFVTTVNLIEGDIWCEDVEGSTIYLNSEKELTPKEKAKVQHVLIYHLSSDHLRVEYL